MEKKSSNGWKFFALLFGGLLAAVVGLYIYKQQNPELKVIVTGCLAERYRSQIEEEIPEVDAVVGCASNKAIDTIVARLFQGENHLESYGAKKDFPLGGKRVIGTPAHYAYLKIAEGCNNRCHYCAIPGIRGPAAQPRSGRLRGRGPLAGR